MTTVNTTADLKKALPAYLNLVKLQKLIEVLSTTRVSTITTESLKGEFGATDASVAMGTLRFLDLVDETGKAKEAVKGFHLQGDERMEAVAKIVQSSYAQLFDFVVGESPQNLSQEKLTNHFIKIYGVVPRIATPAVRAFLLLCEEAGMKEKSVTVRSVPTKTKKIVAGHTNHKVVSPAKKTPIVQVENVGSTSIPFAEGRILLVLPSTLLSNTELIDEYKTALTALKTFSEKCLPFLNVAPNSNDE